ncbi:hypothetical protein Tco_0189245 [Tanacetum coccineum]
MIIDKGDASSDTLHKRTEVVKSIQEVDKLCAMEASQKAKIKWAIEGDENSKYYHGILNKKRNQLSIRGVLVEGDWVENPNMVKNEFLNHFKNRFDRPKSVRPMLNMEFPHHLNSMQQLDLEAEVSNEEIKKAVWHCLSINLSKSKLLGVVVSEDRVVQAANRIGCGVLKAPFAYLGSKVGGNMSWIKSWDEIVDKIVDCLSKWKMKTLSIGGHLTLLKAKVGTSKVGVVFD